eukprot:7705264-Lingulodinium_polyedra.AAC.1
MGVHKKNHAVTSPGVHGAWLAPLYRPLWARGGNGLPLLSSIDQLVARLLALRNATAAAHRLPRQRTS